MSEETSSTEGKDQSTPDFRGKADFKINNKNILKETYKTRIGYY